MRQLGHDFKVKEPRKCMSKQRNHTREWQSLDTLKDAQLPPLLYRFYRFLWQKNFLIHIQEVFAFYHFTPSVYFRVSYLYLWKSTNHCVIITLFNIILKCLFELSLLSAWPLHFFIKPTAASTYILNKSTDITIGKKKRNGKEFFEYAPIFVSSQCIYIIYTFQWRETIGHSIHWHSYLLLTLKSSWIKSLKYLRKDWS